MNDTARAIKFFYLYFKKYKLQFAVIVVFVIAATYLQVKAPVIMGDAITHLTTYVGDFFLPINMRLKQLKLWRRLPVRVLLLRTPCKVLLPSWVKHLVIRLLGKRWRITTCHNKCSLACLRARRFIVCNSWQPCLITGVIWRMQRASFNLVIATTWDDDSQLTHSGRFKRC